MFVHERIFLFILKLKVMFNMHKVFSISWGNFYLYQPKKIRFYEKKLRFFKYIIFLYIIYIEKKQIKVEI